MKQGLQHRQMHRFQQRGLVLLLCLCLLGAATLTAQTVSADSIRNAIAQGVAYFQEHRDQVDPDAYLIYHYLHNNYGISRLRAPELQLETMQQDSLHFAELQPFLRILHPEPFQLHFLAAKGLIDDITAAGVWYDHLEHKGELAKRIRRMDFADDYNVTHALLAMTLAERYHGARPKTRLKARLLARMDAIIARPGPLCDVQIEAIALRQFADSAYVAPAAQIKRILAQQHPNGSWERCPLTEPNESQHTTVLTLWALLGYKPLHSLSKGAPFLHLK